MINLKTKKIGKYLGILLLLHFVMGCSVLQDKMTNVKNLAECKFEFADVEKKVSFRENTNNFWNYVITLRFNGNNPNTDDVKIGNYKLDLYVNGKLLTQISSPSRFILTAERTTPFEIKAIIAPTAALGLFWKKLQNQRIEYQVRGTFYLALGVFQFPINLNLFKYVENGND